MSAPLDLLIVGGGPAGTAAAFRAKELGLEPLVVDYDDLMKRIRDYSKDKMILPDFGGGDRLCFPKGDELIAGLRFPPIDKDEMCAGWKDLYAEHGVSHEVGLEVTGLAALDDGSWEASIWDHTHGQERGYTARHVVLALGRGVPRRFDIPGNCDGVAYKLADAQAYVGRSACVVGGGTSAAEAVIAISEAKAAARDPTAVYWSYRGTKMPRVSKALADVFFAAFVGNGNIRYCRRSEPAAVVTGDDKREYLAVRVDRRAMEGRPNETTHLEFAKEQVIACIGEDLPKTLLASFGIEMVAGGPKGRTRMAVNRYLESCRPNLYLIGDLLSQAYFETDDFAADPAGFREVKHRGNIKSALRDGVLVAQVIQQRLAGKEEVDVRVEEFELDAAPAAVRSVVQADDRQGPPAESLEPGRDEGGEPGGGAALIRVLPTGVEEAEYVVRGGGVTTIGRGDCDLSFPNDDSLAERHASISHSEDGYALRDDGGASGVFLRVPAARKRRLTDGDLLRAGRQFLVVARTEDGYSIVHYDAEGTEVGRHPLSAKALVCGRQAPDLNLDADDPTLSRRHLAFATENGSLWVKDLKSVNGTYLRVRAAERLEHGDQIRVGQQSLTFSLRPEEALDEGSEAPTAEPEKVEAAAAEAGVAVTFRPAGKTVQVAPGETICEAAERAGVEINAECHSGICGSDPIRIVKGAENLTDEPGDQERETLEELCELEPGGCRLACLARASGPVEVEIF
ncbi:MAG: FHA domain-containing protein [Thermoanaerobaculia bacterium]